MGGCVAVSKAVLKKVATQYLFSGSMIFHETLSVGEENRITVTFRSMCTGKSSILECSQRRNELS